jgi:ABC-2 type transport system permease protein
MERSKSYFDDLPSLAGLRGVLTLISVNFQQRLVYRFSIIAGLLRTLAEVMVFRQLWISLYSGRQTYSGVTLDQTLLYAVVSIIISPLFPNMLVNRVSQRIRSGDIIFDITRPLHISNQLFSQVVGATLSTFLTTSLPMLVLVSVFMRISWPVSAMTWGAFSVSFAFGYIISFLIDYIAALLGFWLTNTSGVLYAKWSITRILGGTYVPLWVFPSILGKLITYLPFAAVSYVPLSILVGRVAISQVPQALATQVIWIIVLWCLSRAVYSAGVHKLSVQGG